MKSFLGFQSMKAAFAAMAALLLPALAQAQYDPDWARNFRVGILSGYNIKADFRTSSGGFPISGPGPGEIGVSGQNHFFDDGYVRVDSSGNAGESTWFWGYENSGQYDDDNNQMLMHSTSGFSDPTGSSGRGSDSPYVGLDLAYGGMLWQRGWVRVGWEFGFSFVPISIRQRIAPHDVTATRSTYAFNLYDVIPPDGPYEGTFSGPGPLLEDIASLVGSEDADAELSGTRMLDVNLYLLRLGPSVFFDLTPRWGVSLSAGPAMGIVDGSHKFNDVLEFDDGSTVESRGRISRTEFVYGAYVSGAVTYHAVPNGDFYLSVQYSPMGRASFGGGGREARLDLTGPLFVSAGINWPF